MKNQIGASPSTPETGDKNIINLCWHPVTCKLGDKYYHWPANKGPEVRVRYKKIDKGDDKFAMIAVGIENLPPEDETRPEIKYIVSRQCLQAAKERKDLISPGEQAPDKDQNVKYCVGWLEHIQL